MRFRPLPAPFSGLFLFAFGCLLSACGSTAESELPSGMGGQSAMGGSSGAPEEFAPPESDEVFGSFIASIVEANWGDGQDFNQERALEVLVGPPKGSGCCAGSIDVVSLGEGGSIVLELDKPAVDREGPDFVVFENAFEITQQESEVFVELGSVEVSDDGENWLSFPCDAAERPFAGCAGKTPTYNDDWSSVSSDTALEEIGGDAFDLAELGIASIRYVRITDVLDAPGTFDLDAIWVRNEGD